MKIVFFGTPSFAAHILQYLIANSLSIVGVVTQPDKEKGRTSKKAICVKDSVLSKLPHTSFFQPNKASQPDFLNALQALEADLFVVAAYGKILPSSLLQLPKIDTINVHTSLLPKYRGAAPIQRAMMNDEKETGVTIMKVIKELDAGDIIAQQSVTISDDMNAQDLEDKLCKIAKPLLLQVIKNFSVHSNRYTSQNEKEATYAPKIKKEERDINWHQPSRKIFNLIRALAPFPGAVTKVNIGGVTKHLIIKKSRINVAHGKPGQILDFQEDRFVVACQEGALELLEVQLEGKKSLLAKDFILGIKQTIYLS